MTILNDGTKSNETRLGAIGSIQFAIQTGQLENEPLLVIGGDTLLDVNFDMLEFLEKAEASSHLQTYVTGRKRHQFRSRKEI